MQTLFDKYQYIILKTIDDSFQRNSVGTAWQVVLVNINYIISHFSQKKLEGIIKQATQTKKWGPTQTRSTT